MKNYYSWFRKSSAALSMVLISFMGFGQLSGSYTIGGTSPDYTTVAAAASALNVNGVSGAVVFDIRSGTYTGQISFGSIFGASATNSVRFRPDPANTAPVIIEHNSTGSSTNYTIEFDASGFVSIDSCVIKALGTTYSRVISLTGLNTDLSFTGNEFLGDMTGTTTSSFRAIFFDNSGTSNMADNITLVENTFSGGSYSVYCYGNSSSVPQYNWTFEGNDFVDYYYRALHLYYVDGVTANDNTIMNRKAYTSSSGMYGFYAKNISINNNYVNIIGGTSSAYGMYFSNCAADIADRKTISNNVITQSDGTGGSFSRGLYLNNPGYMDVIYNSISWGSSSSSSTYAALYVGSGDSIFVQNNTALNRGSGYGYYQGSATFTNSNNNAYSIGDTSLSSNMTQAYKVDPLYTSETDLTPYSTSLYQTGTPFAAITEDIDGNTRSTTTPSIGAYEFTLYLSDAGVSSFVNAALCSGSQPIEVRVRNFGRSTLASFKVDWDVSVNGAAPVAQTQLVVSSSAIANLVDTAVNLGNYTLSAGTTYRIRAWSADPNGVQDLRTKNDTMTLTLSPALSGVFTVGTGPADDYPTMDSVVNDLMSKGVCGPVEFQLRDETFNEQVTIGAVNGASAVNTITIRSHPSNANMAVWEYAPTASATNYIVNVNGASHLSIDSIKFRATASSSYGRIIFFGGSCNNISFNGDSLIGRSGAATSTFDALIYEDNAPKIDSVLIENCNFIGGSYSIYGNGPSTTFGLRSEHWIVENNQMLDWGYTGIRLSEHRYDTVRYNTVISADQSRFQYGMYGYYFLGDISSNTFEVKGYGYGIICSWTTGATGALRGKIANNMVSLLDVASTSTARGINVGDGDNWDIFYNSVYVENAGINAKGIYIDDAGSVAILNNSVYCEGPSGCEITSGSTVDTANFNNWYSPNGTAALGFTQGVNSINTDPGYVASDDLHASSSLMYRVGTPIVGVTEDIDGDTRNSTNPTIGADEYIVPDYDAGVIGSSVGAICNGSQLVTVTVANLGYLDLTSFDVHWSYSVNGATPVVGNTITVGSSNISIGTDTVVSLGNVTFNSGSTYSFEVYTVSPSGQTDQRHSNDTANFDLRPALTGTFVIGSGGDYAGFQDAIDALDDLGMCGPVTFNVLDSLFVENIRLDNIVGISSVNTLTFQSDASNTSMPILEGNQEIGDIEYLKLSNINFKSTNGYTIHLEGRNEYVTIDSCKIEGGSNTSSSTASIYDARGANTFNLEITNNEIIQGYYGIYFYGGGAGRTARDENITIENNTITESRYAIYDYYIADSKIINNTIITATGSNSAYGIYGSDNNNMEVAYNTIKMKSSGFQYGLRAYEPNYNNPLPSDSTRIYNNVIGFTNSLATGSQYGIYTYYATQTSVIYNNVKTTTSSTFTNYAGYEMNSSNTTVSNNIFFAENGAPTTYELDYVSWGPTVVNNVRESNGYWTGTPGTFGNNGFTLEASAINANPNYANVGNADLRVNAPEYDSTGFIIQGISDDNFKSMRSATHPDVGAVEFDVCYHNAGMEDVSSVYSSVPVGQSVYVYGKVANRGLDTIKGTNMNAFVAGVASSSLIGTLAPGQDSTVAVLAPVGNTAGQISASMYPTINEMDCDSTNDTLNYVINVSDSIYAADDSTFDFQIGFPTGSTGEFGTAFELFQPDVLTTGSFYLFNPTQGASVKLKLYSIDVSANPDTVYQVVDSTRGFQVGANASGWYTLEFGCGGVPLAVGKYLIAIQQINPVPMNLAFNSAFLPGRPETRYVRGTGGTWQDINNNQNPLISNSTLLLRANFGEISDKEILNDTTFMCFGSSVQVKTLKEYAFQTWSTGSFFDSIKVSQPSMISVRVEDAIGCEYFDTTEVVRTQPIVVSDNVTNASCNDSDGVAIVQASGNNAPFTYHWNNGHVGDTLNSVPGDIYTVTAVDSIGCEQDLDVEVLGATPIVSSAFSYPTCNGDNDGGANVVIDKGVPGYTYAWSSGSSTDSESNLSAGNYTVTVTDKSNCPNVMSITVMNPPVINVVMKDVSPTACKLANGTAEASVTGGIAPLKFLWSNSQTTSKSVGLTEGTYDVTITDSLGCVKTSKVKVIDPNSPISVPNNVTLDCSYDTATASVTINGGTAPFKYIWSSGGSTTALNGVTQGIYKLRVEDAVGCDHDTSVVISAPSAINITFGNFIDNGQNNVQVTASGTGGTRPYSSFMWSNNETDSTALNLPNGVNTVTVVDANGCSFTQKIDIFSETTGLSAIANSDAFKIYPNPTTGLINIDFNLSTAENVTVRVMNAVGEVIQITERTDVANEKLILDISGYASGVYFVETSVGNEKMVSRIQLSK